MEAARIVMSGMWLQEVDSISSGNSKLLMIFIGIVAFSMLTQAIVFIVAAVLATKARNRVVMIVEEVRLKTIPLLDNTASMVKDLQPKIKVITENLVETSHVVRAKAAEFDATIADVNRTILDVNHKTRAQADRVDNMVTSVLTSTADIAAKIEHGIKVPVREVTGLVNGLKAGLDVLIGRTKGFGSYRTRTPYTPVPPSVYQEDDLGM